MRLILTVFLLLSGPSLANAEVKDQTLQELQQMRSAVPSLLIIDSRAEDQVNDGMIEGAINLPVYNVDEKNLAEIAKDKTAQIVFYCNDKFCGASTISAIKAKKLGYNNIYTFEGGIKEWVENKLPINRPALSLQSK